MTQVLGLTGPYKSVLTQPGWETEQIHLFSAWQLDESQDIRDVGARSAPQRWEPIIRSRLGGFVTREALST